MTEERRQGDRRGEDRVVYSRGPIIRTLEVASVITSVGALAALVLSLILFAHRFDDIQRARFAAYRDMCYAVRTVAIDAYPARLRGTVLGVLVRAGLGDCDTAAKDTLTPPHRL